MEVRSNLLELGPKPTEGNVAMLADLVCPSVISNDGAIIKIGLRHYLRPQHPG